ncbi:uncharacterized protein DS421_19g668770 [Arachis hypogaea]|uniref:Uncharacterized protein n=1 Tax=Arachis hypogaea TaxID=3818 RepID=A0A6B9VCG5_ARAHY|nr:uncharacterized protein DS421_19g668770 [Arachis hypogaea]
MSPHLFFHPLPLSSSSNDEFSFFLLSLFVCLLPLRDVSPLLPPPIILCLLPHHDEPPFLLLPTFYLPFSSSRCPYASSSTHCHLPSFTTTS